MNEKKKTGFRKSLGTLDGIAILIGITIGAGIYSTPHDIAGYQESFGVIIGLWVLVGLFVFLGGLIYSELGSRLPHTGGEYVYITKAFGPFAGFIFGWAQLFIIRTSPAAALALIIVRYLGEFVSLNAWGQAIAAIAVILLVGVVNYVGIDRASLFQKATTLFKVGGLFALVIAGLVLVQGSENKLSETAAVTTEQSGFADFAAAILLIVFTYLGFDRVGYSAGEMKNPKRTIPLSMFWGIGIVIVVYAAANLLYHQTLGIETLRQTERVAAETAKQLIGPLGAALVAVMVMISAAGSINGTMMTAPRVYYRMSHDGLFFRWFDHIHPRFQTPSRAIIAHCGWAIVILLVRANFENIVTGMAFAVLVFYVVTTLAYFKLRWQKVGGDDVFKIPQVIPAFYMVGLICIISIRGFYFWKESLADLAYVASGIPFAIYFVFFAKPRSK